MRARVVQLVALSNEYCDKTGKEVDLAEKTWAIWMLIDADSKEKAQRKNLVEGDTPFAQVCDHLEAISSEEGTRSAGPGEDGPQRAGSSRRRRTSTPC